MVVSTGTHLVERDRARVLRPSIDRGERQVLCELQAERFMGVLLHPVPALDMYEHTRSFRSGSRIAVLWPRDGTRWYAAAAGDEIEVGDRRFTIRGIRDNPPCYSDVYVDNA